MIAAVIATLITLLVVRVVARRVRAGSMGTLPGAVAISCTFVVCLVVIPAALGSWPLDAASALLAIQLFGTGLLVWVILLRRLRGGSGG